MSVAAFIVGAVVIVAILVVAAWSLSRRQRTGQAQRSEQLREQFGPEYDRTLAEKGDARSAENELTARQKRVAKLTIRPLASEEGQQFTGEWQAVQMGFVDDPSVAVRDADALVGKVLDARGYPEGDFDQRFADVSVGHPAVLVHYRTAHEIGLRHAQGDANTEDLRQVMLNDHVLFTELIHEEPAVVEPAVVETVEVPEDTAVVVAAK